VHEGLRYVLIFFECIELTRFLKTKLCLLIFLNEGEPPRSTADNTLRVAARAYHIFPWGLLVLRIYTTRLYKFPTPTPFTPFIRHKPHTLCSTWNA